MADLNTISNQLDKAIADFKEQGDRLAALEKKGQEGADVKAAMDKCNNEITRLTDELSKARAEATERGDEIEARIERMAFEGAAGGKGEKAQAAREFFAAVQKTTLQDANADVDAYSNYCRAFAQYLTKGDNGLASEVKAALSVGSDPDGGYFVPAEMESTIVTRLRRTSPLRGIASVLTIGRDAIEFPNDTNDGIIGGWVAETGTRSTNNTPQVGKQRIEVHEHYSQPEVTTQILEDAVIDIGAWLTDKTADKFARVENAAFVTGNGVGKPRGFTTYTTSTTDDDASTERAWGTLQHVVTGSSGGFPKFSGTNADDIGPFEDLIAKMNPSYLPNAVFAMRSDAFATIRKLRDADGRPFWDRSLRDGFDFSLAGYPVVLMQDMPAVAADSLSIAFGDFREGYLIVDRRGTQILRDPYTKKGFVRFYTTRRVGGDVRNFDAIKFLKFSA